MVSSPVEVGVYVGENLKRYAFGNNHPFGPDRHDAFWNEAVTSGLANQVQILAPVICDESDLERFHDEEYIQFLKKSSIRGTGFLDHGDTPVFPGIFEAASYVVGSDLDALDRNDERRVQPHFHSHRRASSLQPRFCRGLLCD